MERTYSRAELEEAALLAAGATSGVFLEQHPQDVMPSQEVESAVRRVLADYDREHPTAEELCYEAWGVIANAWGGDWSAASNEWYDAATRWRDRWHELLDRVRPVVDAEVVDGRG